jgi:acetamidase/formamidase
MGVTDDGIKRAALEDTDGVEVIQGFLNEVSLLLKKDRRAPQEFAVIVDDKKPAHEPAIQDYQYHVSLGFSWQKSLERKKVSQDDRHFVEGRLDIGQGGFAPLQLAQTGGERHIMATHTFVPEAYHNTLGSHEPALSVEPGDTVITTTADAAGQDAEMRKVATPGNPLTGPFFVTGAEPGDTIVVHFRRLVPNREKGWSYTGLQPNVVDPSTVRDLPEQGHAEWLIDSAKQTVEVIDGPEKLRGIALSLAPFLGCFGVAPRKGQAISSTTAGDHGGNMDYRGFTAGVSAYLPVFMPGALIFVGDGHAVQGSGEISGSGVEVSFGVEFGVSLLKGKGIRRPRGEEPESIFTVGNARPLDQAVQHATTEMLSWLTEDFGFDPLSATTLLGQSVEYEVGNVIDPAYTMVCRMAKSLIK